MHARHAATVAAATLLAAGSTASAQQAFPTKPIRLIVAQVPGSSNEILARIVAQKMSASVGQQVVVDTRPGASGVIGTELAARAAPDGYTLVLASQTAFATLPGLKRKLPFDPEKDFIPITRIAWVANVVAVPPSGPATMGDLVAQARAQPGRFNYGSAGNGSPAHLAGEMLNVLAGIRTTHVPYKGASLAVTDLIAGQIQMLITSPLVITPHANNGRLRMIASTGAKPDPLLPNLPVVADTVPGYDITQWWGLATVARTPPDVVRRLHQEAAQAIRSADVRERVAQQGATVVGDTPESFAAFIRAERERIATLIKRAGLPLED